MGHEVKIGGVVRTLQCGEVKIGGVVQTIQYGEVKGGGVVQTLPFEKAFADTPWSEIVTICEGVYNGTRGFPTGWAIGDSHTLKIYDSATDAANQTANYTDYEVVIIGMEHDEGTDNPNPLTLQLKECFAEMGTMEFDNENQPDGSTGEFAYSYDQTKMHLTTLPGILGRLDPDVKDAVRTTHKYVDACEGSLGEYDADGLFLLNGVEVFDGEAQADAYSQQYAYYADGASTVKTRNSTACEWWLSNATDSSHYFAYAAADGTLDPQGLDSVSRGISFAFCL